MTYQHISQRAIQVSITLLLVLFSWVTYHQMMGNMVMESSPDCAAYCFIAGQIDINDLVQLMYFSFLSGFVALVVYNLVIQYHRLDAVVVNPGLRKLNWYFKQQRWKNIVTGDFCAQIVFLD